MLKGMRWALVGAMALAAGCEQSGSDGSDSGTPPATSGGSAGAAPASAPTPGESGGRTYSGGSASPTPAPSGSAAPNGSTFTLRPKSLAGKADMAGIAECVKAFQVNMDRYPTTSEGLDVLVSPDRLEHDKDKWQGPYVQSVDMLVDTYGNRLEYESTGSGFVLRSLGADGVRGGSGSSADIELRQ